MRILEGHWKDTRTNCMDWKDSADWTAAKPTGAVMPAHPMITIFVMMPTILISPQDEEWWIMAQQAWYNNTIIWNHDSFTTRKVQDDWSIFLHSDEWMVHLPSLWGIIDFPSLTLRDGWFISPYCEAWLAHRPPLWGMDGSPFPVVTSGEFTLPTMMNNGWSIFLFRRLEVLSCMPVGKV